MPQGDGLVSFNKMDPEKAREIQKMGAKASAEARHKRKQIRKCFSALLEKQSIRECFSKLRDMKVPENNEIAEKLKEFGLDKEATLGMAMAYKCIEATLDGNPQMARLVFEMLGESKTEIDINGTMPVVIHDDIK